MFLQCSSQEIGRLFTNRTGDKKSDFSLTRRGAFGDGHIAGGPLKSGSGTPMLNI